MTVNPDLLHLLSKLKDRKVSPGIVARVARLNPSYREGAYPRGLHRAPTYRSRWMFDELSKGQVICKFGRPAWDGIPRDLKRKSGKRAYVSRYAVEDRLWMAH